jgi:hypothetical protein
MGKYHKAAWDDEARQCERETIMKKKPWLKSTGPRTPEGKAKSKMNALKTSPGVHALIKEYERLMKEQKVLQNIILR